MKRITPEQVVEAYETTGYKPIRMGWFIDRGDHCEACGLTVCSVANGNTPPRENGALITKWTEYLSQSLGISKWYLHGFVAGFDQCHSALVATHTEAGQGYRDGLAAAHAVFQGSK
jgi:hypothetical protein